MAIKLKKTVKKFSSTKPAWDELENCIKENCSESIKKLIEAGESQDKIKDTVNYLIDHIMEGDSESKEFSEVRNFADKLQNDMIAGIYNQSGEYGGDDESDYDLMLVVKKPGVDPKKQILDAINDGLDPEDYAKMRDIKEVKEFKKGTWDYLPNDWFDEWKEKFTKSFSSKGKKGFSSGDLLLGIAELKSKYSDMSENELMDALDMGEDVYKKPFITSDKYSMRKDAYNWFEKVLKDKGINDSDKHKYAILYWDDMEDLWIEY